jgi:hypothetical protein
MKQSCLACGVEKDRSIREVYPYAEEDGLIDDPIDPLMEIQCRGRDWRVVTVCFDCFHRLSPDMWISEACWLSLNPVTPYDQLPK